MKKLTMLLALGVTMALMPSVSKATIVGSNHDFYFNSDTNLWGGSLANNPYNKGTSSSNVANSVCSECHSVHHNQDQSLGPLWVHKSSAYAISGYATYESGSSETYANYGLTKPSLGSASLACLSCHDGTVGVNEKTQIGLIGTPTTTDSYGKGTNAFMLNAATGRIITVNGNDLTHTHPIGISYADALTKTATAAGVAQLNALTPGVWPYTRLKSNHDRLECATCHDIHNTATIPSGTAKCIACHIK